MAITTTNQPLFYTILMKKLWHLCSRDVVISSGVCNISINHWKVQRLAMEAEQS